SSGASLFSKGRLRGRWKLVVHKRNADAINPKLLELLFVLVVVGGDFIGAGVGILLIERMTIRFRQRAHANDLHQLLEVRVFIYAGLLTCVRQREQLDVTFGKAPFGRRAVDLSC